MDAIKFIEKEFGPKKGFPEFRSGDQVIVSYEIVEGDKRRIQDFKGDVIKIQGQGVSKTFTVRKISGNVGVERVFPMNNPFVSEIKVLKRGKVRRARLYYLRNLVGKKAKIKERSTY